MKRTGFTAVDALSGLLIVSYIVAAGFSGVPMSCLFHAVPYVAVYLALSSLSSRTVAFSRYAVLLLGVWGASEAVVGLFQLMGTIPSNNMFFPMTGSFKNPGPYGGFLSCTAACLVPYVLNHDGGIRGWIAGVCLVLCVLVLPSTMSRAALLAFAVALTAFLMNRESVRLWCSSHTRTLAILLGLCVLACVGLFFLKKDSALGRTHVWHMGLRAIADAPVTGHGPMKALGALGCAQADYFAASARPAFAIRVAGCPEYVFNEYVKVGIEAGLPGLVCCILLVYTCIRRLLRNGSPMAYGAIALAVFSFFSYPMSLWQFRAVAVLMASCACSGSRGADRGPVLPRVRLLSLAAFTFAALMLIPRYVAYREADDLWEGSSTILGEDEVEVLASLYGTLRYDYRYLYEYGYALYQEGRYDDAICVLETGSLLSCDPLFHVIAGRCHEEQGRYERAEACYRYAHDMVPCRLYPLVRLFRMLVRIGKDAEAVEVAECIMDMEVNAKNMTMVRLQEEISVSLDSLRKAGGGWNR